MDANEQSAVSPWGTGATPGRQARLQLARRWVDRLTVLLVAALGCVTVVMTALAARDGMQSRPPNARLGIDRAMRQRGWAVSPGEARSRYAPKRRGKSGPTLFDKLFPAPVAAGDQPTQGPIVALEPLVLLERADDRAPAVTTIDAGEVAVVSKEMGDWVLVVAKQGDRTVFGWTHRDRVRRINRDLGLPGGD